MDRATVFLSSILPSRSNRLIALGLAVYTIGITVVYWIHFDGDPPSLLRLVGSPVGIALAIVAWLRSRREEGSQRWAWRGLAVCAILRVHINLTTYPDFVAAGRPISVTLICLAGFGFVMSLGWQGLAGVSRYRVALDSAWIAGMATMSFWFVTVDPYLYLTDGDITARINFISPLVVTFATLGLVVNLIVHSRGPGRIGFAFIWVTGAILTMAATHSVLMKYSDFGESSVFSFLWFVADPALLLVTQLPFAAVSRGALEQSSGRYLLGLTVVPLIIGCPVLLWSAPASLGVTILVGFGILLLLALRVCSIQEENKRLQTELHSMALSDSLTGIPNRRALLAELERVSVTDRTAIVFLDLDYFKIVNDEFGHESGDEVLREFACRLLEVVRKPDSVFRLGGDEFIVLIVADKQITESMVASVVERLRTVVSTKFFFATGSARIGMTVGVCVGTDGMSANQLVDKADLAMIDAKRKGRSSVGLEVESAEGYLE